jgi:hypothetical protein
MNGVKNEIHVRVEQTARGVWYCSGVDVYDETTIGVKVELDVTMAAIEAILFKHNAAAEEDKQHTDLSTADPRLVVDKKVRK